MKKGIKFGKLLIEAGKATPAPPITPCLGQRGIRIPDFCKKFNDESKQKFSGEKLPLKVYFSISEGDKSLQLDIKGPSVSAIIMEYFSFKKGGSNVGHESIGDINTNDARQIAERVLKYRYMNTSKVDSVIKTIISVAKSIGMTYTS